MQGIVTDVCIKRKIRDYVSGVLERPIFIQSETALNTLIKSGFKDAGVDVAEVELQEEIVLEWLKNQKDSLDDLSLNIDDKTFKFTGEKFDKKVGKFFEELFNRADEEIKKDWKDSRRKSAR